MLSRENVPASRNYNNTLSHAGILHALYRIFFGIVRAENGYAYRKNFIFQKYRYASAIQYSDAVVAW